MHEVFVLWNASVNLLSMKYCDYVEVELVMNILTLKYVFDDSLLFNGW